MSTIPQSVLWQVSLAHPFNKELLRKAILILDTNALRSAPSGNFVVKSNTEENVEYIIDPNAEQCGCPAGQHDILCSHLLALLLRQELFLQTKAEAMASGTAHKDVISLREKQAKEHRPALGEWEEELI